LRRLLASIADVPRPTRLAPVAATALLLVLLAAVAWLAIWLFWNVAYWLHHRPGPRGLDGAWYGGRPRR
jgi:hypothetical protein